MKKLSLGLLAVLGFPVLTQAAESTLSIANHVENIQAIVAVDLLCGKFINEITTGSTKYTSYLDENPINTGEKPITATWKNCAIVNKNFKADHNKIIIGLKDLSSGKILEPNIILEVINGAQTKAIDFEGRTITLTLKHSGAYGKDYIRDQEIPMVTTTDTELSID